MALTVDVTSGAAGTGPAGAGSGSSNGDTSNGPISGLLLAMRAMLAFLLQSNDSIAATANVGAALTKIQTQMATAQQQCLDTDQQNLANYADNNKPSGNDNGVYSAEITKLSNQYQKDSTAYQSLLTELNGSTETTNTTVQGGTAGQKTAIDLFQSVLEYVAAAGRLLA